MLLNGFNSDDYIYLSLNNDLNNKKFILKKGDILRFLKSEIEESIYSRLIHQGIYQHLNFIRNKNASVDEILPNKVNQTIYFKENTRASLCLWPKERYCFNDWVKQHLFNSEDTEICIFGPFGTRKELNTIAINSGTTNLFGERDNLPMIEIGKDNIDLIFTFEKGEILDFKDPGVMSFLLDREYMELLANSRPIVGEEKEILFEKDFKNAFFASDGIFSENDHIFRYYRINDDVKVKSTSELPMIHVDKCSYDEEGFLRYININQFSFMDFNCCAEKVILTFATEVPLDEAKKMHKERIEEKKKKDKEQLEKWREEEREKNRILNELYEQKKFDTSIFPGANGNFTHKFINDNNKKSTLSEIKRFFENIKSINPEVLKHMYFYGGTLPYIISNAEEARSFGDIDIFVPISKMADVRNELMSLSSFKVYFDSKELTSAYSLTSRIPVSNELSNPENEVLEFLEAMYSDDNIIDDNGNTELENYMNKNRKKQVYQDFGLKGNLFGVNISIFPIYEYKGDLMAKSFNVSDDYKYLLAVRVMNKTNLDNFAKNININETALKMLPIEYTILSKESAIASGYIKREDKDSLDIEYIMEHKSELGIDDDLIAKLKENYPDYSIALAYCLTSGGVETLSGESYKKLMLQNKGRYVS